jgi:hypothetical protein
VWGFESPLAHQTRVAPAETLATLVELLVACCCGAFSLAHDHAATTRALRLTARSRIRSIHFFATVDRHTNELSKPVSPVGKRKRRQTRDKRVTSCAVLGHELALALNRLEACP